MHGLGRDEWFQVKWVIEHSGELRERSRHCRKQAEETAAQAERLYSEFEQIPLRSAGGFVNRPTKPASGKPLR